MESHNPNNGRSFANIDWPDGWFVFEHGIVNGPFSTQEVFSRKTNEADASSYMVSRKGFGRWYALPDLASIYHQADRIGVSTGTSAKDLEDSLNNELKRLTNLEMGVREQRQVVLSEVERSVSEVRKASSPGVSKGPVQPKTVKAEPQISASLAPTEPPYSEGTPALEVRKSSATLQSRKIPSPQAAVLAGGGERVDAVPASKASNASKSKGEAERELAYNHMVLAGRLRLGSLNNPWLEAYAKFFAALGIYWGIWFRRAVIAVSFHIDGSLIPNSNKIFWLAMIPGYHLLMTRKLAMAVASMERQNGYQTVSPTKAALLAIFPPLAIFYLQSVINAHWKLHVRHETQTP